MCFKKIFHRICLVTGGETDAACASLQSQTYEKYINELMSHVIEIDGKKYIKANELIQFMGGQPQFLSKGSEIDAELLNLLIAYRIVVQGEQWVSHFYTKTQIDFKDKKVHYAFDKKIIPWLKKEFKNDKNMPLLTKAVEEVFNNL